MADNKKYYYLKLKENFFDSDEMILLETMPDGYRYSNILLKMYLRSLKDEGRLMLSGKIPYSPEMLATVIRQPVGVVKEALDIFKELGLVSVLDTGAIYMMDIQNFIGKSSSEGDRKRKYRKRIELEDKCPDICPDKNPPETEREKEIEIELEIELETETERTSFLSSLSERRITHTFCEVFNTNSISGELFGTIRATLQAGVSPERIEAMIHSAADKQPREPESYIAAGLKCLQGKAPEQKRVYIKPESKPLEDWEAAWKQEYEAMQQDMHAEEERKE